MSEGVAIAMITTVGGGLFTIVGTLLSHQLQNRQRISTSQSTPISSPAVSSATQTLQIGRVIFDIGIIWILTGLAGFIIGLAVGDSSMDRLIAAAGLANIVFGTIGFVISGTRAPGNRWRHLIAVAIGLWLVNIINVIILGVDLISWFVSLFLVLVMMAAGGAISYFFNR